MRPSLQDTTTEAPWRAVQIGSGGRDGETPVYVVRGEHCVVAEYISKPDADLIAAAPELLASNAELLKLVRQAQERLCTYLCPEGSNDPDECMNDLLGMFDGPEQRRIEGLARAAIAKATGAA